MGLCKRSRDAWGTRKPGNLRHEIATELGEAFHSVGQRRGQYCTFFGFVLAKKVRTDPAADHIIFSFHFL